MRHVVCFSGGKDSTALILWAKENIGTPGIDWIAVYCDTGWESEITYAYIEEINRSVLNGSLVTLRSKKYTARPPHPLRKNASERDSYRFEVVSMRYEEAKRLDGMRSLVQIKGRVPSAKARFCTEALKVLPMADWLKEGDDGDIIVYQGIRADESESRSRMVEREWSDVYDAWVERPLLRWSARDCFAMMARHGIKPNPLYLLGAGRVGCFPCVLINQRELKAFLTTMPEVRGRIEELETISGRTFFPPNYIPKRFHTGYDEASGKSYCWAKDVFRYIESVDEDQLPLLPTRSCMSVYNLCE